MPEKKRKTHYSQGQLNRLIDDLLHPLFKHHPALIIADTLLHSLIEQGTSTSTRKFAEYTLPKIIKLATKKRKTKNSPKTSQKTTTQS